MATPILAPKSTPTPILPPTDAAVVNEANVATEAKTENDAPAAVPAKKLSKKEKKALEFKEREKKLKSGEVTVEELNKKRKAGEDEEEVVIAADGTTTTKSKKSTSQPAKKAKTPNRFILFVGNLPFDCTVEQINEHFKACTPNAVRPRKGFAFVEFEGEDATKRMNVALRLHHTPFGRRKINVELTAGGGGNSANRTNKLREKNEKLGDERLERQKKEAEEEEKKRKLRAKNGANGGYNGPKRTPDNNNNNSGSKPADNSNTGGIHPSRRQMVGR